MQSVFICGGEDGHNGNTKLLARADDPDGDFAAVSNEEFSNGLDGGNGFCGRSGSFGRSRDHTWMDRRTRRESLKIEDWAMGEPRVQNGGKAGKRKGRREGGGGGHDQRMELRWTRDANGSNDSIDEERIT